MIEFIKCMMAGAFIFGIGSIVYGGYRYINTNNDQKTEHETKWQIVFGGLLIFGLMFGLVSLRLIGYGLAPTGETTIIVKETKVEKHVPTRGRVTYTCEVVDKKTNRSFIEHSNSKKKTEQYCKDFSIGQEKHVSYKYFDGVYTLHN